tara:strand:+ start:68 stop:253 length:186 start_codon:yes stop_codon:yes gene_type:complete
MFKVGDIVFLIESGIVNYAKIGLVLDKEVIPRSRNQYRVQFSNSQPSWWEENYLYKIQDEP